MKLINAIPEEGAIGVGSLLPFGARHPHRPSECPLYDFLSLLSLLREYAFPCPSSVYLFLSYSYNLSQVKTTTRNPFLTS